MEGPRVDAFTAASRFFVDAVAAVPPDQYEKWWSDEWRMIDLIAHGNRSNALLVEYYERPIGLGSLEYVRPEDIAEYNRPENIAQRGREAVGALGDDPVAAVRAASDRAVALVAAAPDDAVVGTPSGERALKPYLQVRIAELILHGLDLGTHLEPPADAVADCGAFLVAQSVRADRGVEVVRALSGRGTLGPGFNVY